MDFHDGTKWTMMGFLWCTPAASRGFQLDMTKAGSIGVNHKLCCVLN